MTDTAQVRALRDACDAMIAVCHKNQWDGAVAMLSRERDRLYPLSVEIEVGEWKAVKLNDGAWKLEEGSCGGLGVYDAQSSVSRFLDALYAEREKGGET